MKKTIKLKSLKDTEALAKKMAHTLKGGEVLALSGPLGSGKTTFTQALGRALGAPPEVKSPTFVIMHTHHLSKHRTLCHVDAYRLNDPDELNAVGLHDYLGKLHTITVIEWAEKIKSLLPPNTIWLTFALKANRRTVTIE